MTETIHKIERCTKDAPWTAEREKVVVDAMYEEHERTGKFIWVSVIHSEDIDRCEGCGWVKQPAD